MNRKESDLSPRSLFLAGDLAVKAVLVTRSTALRKDAAADASVYIRGDRTVPYGDVMRVMGKVSAFGVPRVSMIAEGETGATAVQAR